VTLHACGIKNELGRLISPRLIAQLTNIPKLLDQTSWSGFKV